MNPKYLNSRVQKIMFGIIDKKVGLKDEDYEDISKLRYVGGAVENIELMMNSYEEVGASIGAKREEMLKLK